MNCANQEADQKQGGDGEWSDIEGTVLPKFPANCPVHALTRRDDRGRNCCESFIGDSLSGLAGESGMAFE